MSIACNVTGRVFDVQRFCLHDGPGIRTTVFFKGCPLKCKWCHNPESQKTQTELFYHASACIGCGECAKVCRNGAHSICGGHVFDREKCAGCLKCADVCPSAALETSGEMKSVSEIMTEVLRDASFYKQGGGMTVSGGEPFMQPDLLVALLKSAKEAGIHTCVETSGAAKEDDLLRAMEYTDIFLYDCKMIPGERHSRYIGCDGTKLHDNLRLIDSRGARTILRCPIIPEVNDNAEYFAYVAELANSLEHLLEVHLQPYHATGLSKARDIGVSDVFTAENYDASAFKERIRNELLPIIAKSVSQKVVL